MPLSTERLRKNFMTKSNNGGRDIAEKVITDAGGTVEKIGIIQLPVGTYSTDVADAIHFLVNEWDYDYIEELDGSVLFENPRTKIVSYGLIILIGLIVIGLFCVLS